MRSALTAIVALNMATFILIAAPSKADEDPMRNARMDACAALLRKNDKALTNDWRGHCGLKELDREIDGSSPDGPLARLSTLFNEPGTIVSDIDATCHNGFPPIALSTKCGIGTNSIYAGLVSTPSVRIRLPGKKCGSFIPLLLTNKRDFACNAVQTRIACIDVTHDESTDRTTIKLSARSAPPSENVTIDFGVDEIQKHNGRLNELIKHPQFTLIPEQTANGKSITQALLMAKKVHEDACIAKKQHSPAECAKRAQFQADADMQETLRRYRNPGHDNAKSEIKRDGERLVQYLKSKSIDSIPEQWILFLAVADNEVGLTISNGQVSTNDAIYGLSDAILANSGLSFGAHQIDLGANEDKDLLLFWDAVEAFKRDHAHPALDRAVTAKDCIDLPLRLETVGALALTYETAPHLTRALRSDEGVNAYNDRLIAYLAQETKRTSSMKGLFAQSMIFRILYTDLKNQFGSGSRIVKMASDAIKNGTDPTNCRSVRDAENTVLASLIWNNPNDSSAGKTQYARRYEGIEKKVRSLAPNAGISGCS